MALSAKSAQIFDPLLTGFARRYRPEGHIADTVAPRVQVAKESAKYPVFALRDFAANDVDALKPDRAQTKELRLDLSTEAYSVEEYALKGSITDRERRQAAGVWNIEESVTAQLVDRLAQAREVRVAAALSAVTTNATPSNNWNVDAATIEADLVAGVEAAYDLTGVKPNTAIIPWKVANAVAMQQDIREILKYTVNGQQILGGESVLPPMLWGLRIVIANPILVTSAEGQSVTTAPIWGDEVKLLYVDPNPQYGNPSTIQTFQTQGLTVTRWRENDPDAEYIRVSEIVHEKLTSADTGYELRNLLS